MPEGQTESADPLTSAVGHEPLQDLPTLRRRLLGLAVKMVWNRDDAEDIGIELAEKFPDQNPLEIRFTDLHKYVSELPAFVDDPKMSNE